MLVFNPLGQAIKKTKWVLKILKYRFRLEAIPLWGQFDSLLRFIITDVSVETRRFSCHIMTLTALLHTIRSKIELHTRLALAPLQCLVSNP